MWKQITMLDKVQIVYFVNPILESLISLCAGMSYAKAHVHARKLHPSTGLCVCVPLQKHCLQELVVQSPFFLSQVLTQGCG